MNEKITSAWNNIKYFCAEQVVNFYVGMALAVLLLLNLATSISLSTCFMICPFATVAVYLFVRAFFEPPKQWFNSRDVGRSILGTLMGCVWAMFLTVL